MIQIEDIPKDLLYAVRRRLGADDDMDTRFDERIKHLTPKHLVAKWLGYQIDDEDMAKVLIDRYEELKAKWSTPESIELAGRQENNIVDVSKGHST